MNSFCICYNLVPHNSIDIPPFPEAYIAPIKEDKLGYIEKQAVPGTLDSYQIPYQETPHEHLLEICANLKPASLEQRFQSKKSRKKLKLAELIADKAIKETIHTFVTKKLTTFYDIIAKNQYPICYNTDRKDPAEITRIAFSETNLEPLLTFNKTDDGIEYSFSISDNQQEYIPNQHDIKILSNEPAWITLNNKLHSINNLNANKLKPFFIKEVVSIAEKHTKVYVEKVILPIIKNIEVSAQGFNIKTEQSITGYSLEIMEDFIQDLYVGKVIFEYGDSKFDYNSKKSTTSEVLFDHNNQIQITQTKRDSEAENQIINLLTEKELQLNPNQLLQTENTEDPYSIFHWHTTHQSQLQQEGFKSIIPRLIEKKNRC